jgi:hypothetical protein
MAHKDKISEDNNLASKDEAEENSEVFSGNVQLAVTSPAESDSLIVERLSQVYSAFTASTLSQQPLLDGNYNFLSFICMIADLVLALELFDQGMSSVDWSSSNPNRDRMTSYFTTNSDFLPAMVNIWGVSWEVSTGSASCCSSLTFCSAKFSSSYGSNLGVPMPLITRVIKGTPLPHHCVVHCAHNHGSPTQNYLSHIVVRKVTPDNLHHQSDDSNCLYP